MEDVSGQRNPADSQKPLVLNAEQRASEHTKPLIRSCSYPDYRYSCFLIIFLRFFSSICWPTNRRTVTSRVSWATSQDNTKYPSVMRLSVLAILASKQTCEELFTPAGLHIPIGLNDCEIFTNSSGSHHELRKLQNTNFTNLGGN